MCVDKIIIPIEGNKNYADFSLPKTEGSPFHRLVVDQPRALPSHMVYLADAIRKIQKAAMDVECVNAPASRMLDSLITVEDDLTTLKMDVFYSDTSSIDNEYSQGFIDATTDIPLEETVNLIYIGHSYDPKGAVLAFKPTETNNSYLFFHVSLDPDASLFNYGVKL